MVPGELYVANTGIYWTQLLFVVNSDIFQHYLPKEKTRLEKEQYGYTTFNARGAKVPLTSVLILDGTEHTVVAAINMHQSYVQVGRYYELIPF